ncbi:GNAT family N-acetyltransferase [Aureivirga marina]|uniref:GNAT family N-acetyltransferase n=1 Tax=Aureivirga marina TaxID=1182451 RepID=UPI0018C9626D|nr:GNAT family N-acetyltransferase [Aureivirga marina]
MKYRIHMELTQFKVERLKRKDLKQVYEFIKEEGWNPGSHDIKAFFKTDKKGFFGIHNANELIGCFSAVKYKDDFGFLGCFIVKEEYRKKGLGKSLWKHGLEYLGNDIVGLDGVVQREKNYQENGFNSAYTNVRYVINNTFKSDYSKKVKKASKVPFGRLYSYDSKFFPSRRKRFLKEWISLKDSKSFVFLEDFKVKGFITIRKCNNGYKIGPLFSEKLGYAEELLKAAFSYADDYTDIFIDIPEPNLESKSLVEKYNMKEVSRTIRMYKNGIPDLPIDKIYGVTTLELG